MATAYWCSTEARQMVAATVERRISFSALSISASSSRAALEAPPILCSRGDKKIKKGKRFKGSFINSRPKKEKKIEHIKDKVEVPRLKISNTDAKSREMNLQKSAKNHKKHCFLL